MPNLNALLEEIMTNLMGVSLGLLLIFGARKRWSFLVDPASPLRFVYSMSFIKHFAGAKGTIIFCYTVGTLLIVIAGIQATRNLLVLGRGLGYWK